MQCQDYQSSRQTFFIQTQQFYFSKLYSRYQQIMSDLIMWHISNHWLLLFKKFDKNNEMIFLVASFTIWTGLIVHHLHIFLIVRHTKIIIIPSKYKTIMLVLHDTSLDLCQCQGKFTAIDVGQGHIQGHSCNHLQGHEKHI